MKKIFILVFIIAMMVTSCASYQKTAPMMGVEGTRINTYVAADLDYQNAVKVEGEVKTKHFLCFPLSRNGHKYLTSTNRYRGLSDVEKQVLYRAKENSGKDIILDPQFEIEKHRWFFGAYRTSKTKVVGWGIDVKGIKEDPYGHTNGDGHASTSAFNR